MEFKVVSYNRLQLTIIFCRDRLQKILEGSNPMEDKQLDWILNIHVTYPEKYFKKLVTCCRKFIFSC